METMDPNEDRIRAEHGVAPAGAARLSKRHLKVLAALRTQAELNGTGEVCASVADLVKLTKLGSAGVAFARHDLLRWGLIEVTNRGGGAIAPTYRVVTPETDQEFMRRIGITP